MKMYEGILSKVREYENKRGIVYIKPDGVFYKTLKILYTLFTVWTLFMNLFLILGQYWKYDETDFWNEALNRITTVAIFTIIIIVGYLLNSFKVYIVSAIISIICEIFLIFFYARLLEDPLGYMGFKMSFYWRHAVPNALMIILIFIMTVIAVRARYKTKKHYAKVYENLFEKFKEDMGEEINTSSDAWNEFLKNYNVCDIDNITQKDAE